MTDQLHGKFDDAIIDAVLHGPIKRPAKAWRNWYQAKRDFVSLEQNCNRDKGSIYPGINVWPSKDAAETRAHTQYGGTDCEWRLWLGAFPEGERP